MDASDSPGGAPLSAKDERWQIRIRGLRKRFAPGAPEVLRGCDLDLERHKVNEVIGGSGQGRSVLIKHVIGLLRPDAGHVWVDGVDVHALGASQIAHFRRKFGMVFQMAALFDSLTVEENVASPLIEHSKLGRQEIKEKVNARLAGLHLQGAEKKFPGELSGGMRKRVGLARPGARAGDPALRRTDDGARPAGHRGRRGNMILDVQSRLQVTSVVISHDMASVFRIADRVAMIHEGVIIFSGTSAEIRGSPDELVHRFITTSGVGAAMTGGAP